MKDFENPFADYGNIVRGERFIGRKESLKVIENRIIRPKESGNLAIIGEPRVGKSSLIYKAIIERKKELIDKKLLPIWINLGTYDKASIFFRSVVTLCRDELEELNWLSEAIQHSADKALEDELSWSEGYSRIQRFFEKVRQAGYRILIVLDEFDNARKLFKGDISAFQGLRELSYRPEWRINYITASRRSIRDIEVQTGAISTFDGIFHKHYLSMFHESDLQEYFIRFSSIGIALDNDDKDRIFFYCGGHPFLLEMLGYEIVEVYRELQSINIELAAQNISSSFIDQYDRMVALLKEDGSLNKLLQILFGPVVDVKQTDVDEFIKYGLIKVTEQDTYVAFSSHFHSFLSLIGREIDLWPLWSRTEKVLRSLITNIVIKKYGDEWIIKLEKAHHHLREILDKCRESQQREEKSFGSRASKNLIDFTNPFDLFKIIFAEWSSFESIFGKDKHYWGERAKLIAKIRNPLAHNRNELLNDYERQIAEGYCKEILALKIPIEPVI